MQAELTKKIRALAEAEALGHVVCNQSDDLTYDGFMEAENVHEYADIWGPVSGLPSEDLQEMCETEADIFVGFAEAVIAALSVGELLDIIAEKAVESGVARFKGDVQLMLLKQMGASEKDECVRSHGWRNLSDCDEVFTCLDDVDGLSDELQNASSFGISYVNGY